MCTACPTTVSKSGLLRERRSHPSILPAVRQAWAEGTLWVGQYRDRKIHQIDPQTGKVLRTIESNRFVTGVTWVDGELWHGILEEGQSDLRRVDPQTGKVLEKVDMPAGVHVSGLESDGGDRFFCGGATSGKVRAIRRPHRGSRAG
jgi:sugar lactone lactonase YvrE